MQIDVHVVQDTVTAALRRLQQQGGDLTPAMRVVAEILRESSEQSFEDQRAPDGTPWPPLKPSTAREKREKGYSALALVRNGALRTLHSDATATVAVAGTNLVYGAVHQFGSRPETRQNIPPRPFLGLRDDYAREIVDVLRRHLES